MATYWETCPRQTGYMSTAPDACCFWYSFHHETVARRASSQSQVACHPWWAALLESRPQVEGLVDRFRGRGRHLVTAATQSSMHFVTTASLQVSWNTRGPKFQASLNRSLFSPEQLGPQPEVGPRRSSTCW